MADTQHFIGEGKSLIPPTPVPPDTFVALDEMLDGIRRGEPLDKFGVDALDALEQACDWYRRCQKYLAEFTVGYERVYEMGANGPGRALKLVCRWRLPEGPGERVMFPPEHIPAKLAYRVRNLLEACAIIRG